jgi:transcriptional regulator with XRE-family HTH domain
MALPNKIKGLLKTKGKSHADFAAHLGISTAVLGNKFYKDRFSVDDLIRTAEFLDCELAFIVDGRPSVYLGADDLKDKET